MRVLRSVSWSRLIPLACVAALCLFGQLPLAWATVTPLGDVSPAQPWAGTTAGTVGITTAGTLTIDNTPSTMTLIAQRCQIGATATGSGTMTVTGSGAKFTHSQFLYIGNLGTGTLNILSGGTVSGTGTTAANSPFIGYGAGSFGTATVDAGTWTNSGTLTVGNNGSGTLWIQNGGSVSANGAVVVAPTTTLTGTGTGSGSINFGTGGGTLTTGAFVGRASQLTGTGTLNTTKGLITDADLVFDSTHGTTQPLSLNGGNISGGSLTISGGPLGLGNGTLQIKDALTVTSVGGYEGYFASTSCTTTVSGGATWATGSVVHYVGYYGNATLKVTTGGTVSGAGISTAHCYIGEKAASTGVLIVDGPGSTVNYPSKTTTIAVGDNGTGTLTISNGGNVTGSVNAIGNLAGSHGTATVTGSGSSWNAANSSGAGFQVGPAGSGLLIVQDHGLISTNYVQGYGTVTFDGATVRAGWGGNLAHGTDVNGWIASSLAQVSIKEGGVTFNTLDQDGITGGWGAINAPLQHGGTNPVDGGLTKVSAGTLSISVTCTYTGPTVVSGGVLSLANAYLTDANYVRVDSGAVLDLSTAGATDTVRFLFLGGVPQPVGVYNNASSPTYITGTGSLNVAYAVLPGDANADGTVNGADLNIVLSNYNATGTNWFGGDFDNSASTNGADLNIVLSNYNQSIAVAAAVPEPSALLLAGTGVASLFTYLWGRRREK